MTALFLPVLALGKDPEQFGGVNLVEDGIWQYQGGSPGDQGVNGWIYSLIAADAGPYEEPQDAKYTREMMVEEILAEQNEDGSFGLQKGSADPDLTAMALQALAPYQEDNEVKAASDESTYLAVRTYDRTWFLCELWGGKCRILCTDGHCSLCSWN